MSRSRADSFGPQESDMLTEYDLYLIDGSLINFESKYKGLRIGQINAMTKLKEINYDLMTSVHNGDNDFNNPNYLFVTNELYSRFRFLVIKSRLRRGLKILNKSRSIQNKE